MREAQELFYSWLKEVEDVRYERIKQICNYLNHKLALNLEKPTYCIFYPLLYSGVIEFAGNSRYQITPKCIISKNKKKNIVVSPSTLEELQETHFVGIYIQEDITNSYFSGSYHFNLITILKNTPTIFQCLSSYPLIYNSREKELNDNLGLNYSAENNFKRWYFVDSKQKKCYDIPHHSTNPDALNIAYCYDRVIKQESNGYYDTKSKRLKMNRYNIPILIYRLLMVESLLAGSAPLIDNDYYIFENIDRRSYSELNRIFCKSIRIS